MTSEERQLLLIVARLIRSRLHELGPVRLEDVTALRQALAPFDTDNYLEGKQYDTKRV